MVFRTWFSGLGISTLGPGFSHSRFSGCGISILAHDFQDMDGEPGDFTVSEGHGHPLVSLMTGPFCKIIWINCGCIFVGFFFAMGHWTYLSSKTLWNLPSSKSHIFYIIIYLHCFTYSCKIIYIHCFIRPCKTMQIYLILHFHWFTQHKINLHGFTLTWNGSPKPFTHTTLIHTFTL
jgi:hypothetical protein